jgi:hypothetical protein
MGKASRRHKDFIKIATVGRFAAKVDRDANAREDEPMSRSKGLFRRAAGLAGVLAGLATTGQAVAAQPGCDNLPPAVRAYLAGHPGQSVVTLADLNADDLKLWLDAKHGACPGLAVVDLDGSGKPAFAMALLQRRAGGLFEQLVVLRPVGGGVKAVVLERPYPAGNPAVVWRARPGRADPWDGGRGVINRHDWIVFEQIESASTSYYWAGGRFRHITTGD